MLYNVMFHDRYVRGGYRLSEEDGAAEAMFGPHMHPMGFGPIRDCDRVGDFFKSGVLSMGGDDPHLQLVGALCEWYQRHFARTPTARIDCRHYVPGVLY